MPAVNALRGNPATPAPAGSAALPPEIGRIRNLIPLRRLHDDEFAAIVRYASVERRAAGQPLFRAGFDDQWIFYLLEGEIEISDDKGQGFRLQGGTIETAQPLSTHAKARILATVTSDICYVRMPAELLRLQADQRPQQGVEVEELDENSSTVDKQLLFALSHALLDGSFNLPTLPDIALRIRDVAADPGKGITDLVRLVQTDAVIAAYCVKIANSAAYPAATPASGLHDAVLRLGVDATRDLITAFTLKDLYSALDSATRALMRMAWQHSSRIAALSYVVAKSSGSLNAEQALLAGLVHDIGMLVLLREWPAHTHAALDRTTLRAFAQQLNGAVGSMVLRAWHFPPSIVDAASYGEHWAHFAQETLDLCDCVVLAHLHDTAPAPWSSAAPAIEQVAAYRKLANGALSPTRRLVLVDEAKKQLRAVRQLLGA